MGRMLYELGRVDEKEKTANERASNKMGKSSFSWAWQLDGTTEERERFASSTIVIHLILINSTEVLPWTLL